MSHVDGGIAKPLLGESIDISAQDIVQFGCGHPENYYSKEMRIANIAWVWKLTFLLHGCMVSSCLIIVVDRN